jgi:drug/metabolite transporter (DMT)-like permease
VVGLALGLSAALLWGLADYTAAIVSRRTGALNVVAGFHVVAVAVMAVAVVATGDLAGVGGRDVAVLAGIGAVGAVSYVAFYRALAIGPISVVSPIVSGYGAVTVVLSLALLGERLAAAEAVAITVLIGGVMLASADLAPGSDAEPLQVRGVALAIFAMVTFGSFLFGVAYHAPTLGWLAPIFLARAFSGIFLLPVVFRRGIPPRSERTPRLLLTLGVLGLLDTGGMVAFNIGIEHADTAIVGAASSPYAIVPILMGVLVLGERPPVVQRMGVVAVIAGVALLAVVST